MAKLHCNQFRRIGIDHVAGRDDLALLHEILDHVHRALGHTLREFLHRDRFRQHYFTQDLLAGFLLLRTLELLLTATHGRKRTAAAFLVRGERGIERQLATAALVLACLLDRTGWRLDLGRAALCTIVFVARGLLHNRSLVANRLGECRRIFWRHTAGRIDRRGTTRCIGLSRAALRW